MLWTREFFFLSHERHTARRSSFCSFFFFFRYSVFLLLLLSTVPRVLSLSLCRSKLQYEGMLSLWNSFFFLVNVLLSCYSSHFFFFNASLPCSPLLLSKNYKQLKRKKEKAFFFSPSRQLTSYKAGSLSAVRSPSPTPCSHQNQHQTTSAIRKKKKRKSRSGCSDQKTSNDLSLTCHLTSSDGSLHLSYRDAAHVKCEYGVTCLRRRICGVGAGSPTQLS